MDENKLENKVATLTKEVEKLKQQVQTLFNVISAAKEVLTLEEAAIFMGVTKSFLYKMTHTQGIPFYKPNNKMVYFERTELLAWLRQNHVASTAEIEKMAVERMQQMALK